MQNRGYSRQGKSPYRCRSHVHFVDGKQGDILRLPGGKYLHRPANLITHVGNFPLSKLITSLSHFQSHHILYNVYLLVHVQVLDARSCSVELSTKCNWNSLETHISARAGRAANEASSSVVKLLFARRLQRMQ